MDLVDRVYALTKSYPKDEIFALAMQTKRSAVSVPSNIAEGSQRGSSKEFIRFLNIAYASLAELETQLEIAFRQQYLDKSGLDMCYELSADTGKMLNGLITSIKNKETEQTANSQLQTAN